MTEGETEVAFHLLLPQCLSTPPLSPKPGRPKRPASRHLGKLRLSQLPLHLSDNRFIHSGYRAFYSTADCIRSVFEWHNESINIWTHLISLLFCLNVLYDLVSLLLGGCYSSAQDIVLVGVYIGTLIQCYASSTCYHTLSAHKCHSVFHKSKIYDLCGISSVIFGTGLSLVHFGMRDQLWKRVGYSFMLWLVNATSHAVSLNAKFQSAKFAAKRALYYSVTSVLSTIIVVSGCWRNGRWLLETLGRGTILLEAAFFAIGAVVYAAKIPERWRPGRCDFVANGHQIMHLCVMAATGCHFAALRRVLDRVEGKAF